MGKRTETRETRAQRKGPGGGRPRKDGDRYPNGRLKPEQPNPRVLAIRALLGVSDPRRPCTPLRLAHDRGWLTDDQYTAGNSYADTYKRAQIGAPGVVVMSDTSIQSGVDDVPTEARISDMKPEVIAKVWDSAMRDVVGYEGPERAQEKAEAAMVRWKLMTKAMTADQRREVDQLCLRESWPDWVMHRATGNFNSPAERQRDALIAGLEAIAGTSPRRKAANDDKAAPRTIQPANDPGIGPVRTDRTIYVDQDGKAVLTVERRSRNPAA